MKAIKAKRVQLKTKRVFLKKGTCSRTFFYILNREFGHSMDKEEQAIDALAGGILQQGYQCGMLWGASMAVGAESTRRLANPNQAAALAIKTTQHLVKSFVHKTNSTECLDITNCDWTSKWDMTKFFFSGKILSCLKLAEKWAPEAIETATEGLDIYQSDLPQQTISCASEVVNQMGGSQEEMTLVAGFAGGLGLSGNGCGVLAAAIWKTQLNLIREDKLKSSMTNPETEKILENFYTATDYAMECYKISGKCFKTIEEHTDFIKNGGCKNLIHQLANSNSSK